MVVMRAWMKAVTDAEMMVWMKVVTDVEMKRSSLCSCYLDSVREQDLDFGYYSKVHTNSEWNHAEQQNCSVPVPDSDSGMDENWDCDCDCDYDCGCGCGLACVEPETYHA
jgi:hypothetical protein